MSYFNTGRFMLWVFRATETDGTTYEVSATGTSQKQAKLSARHGLPKGTKLSNVIRREPLERKWEPAPRATVMYARDAVRPCP